ncbi:Arc family DNA-binding protein [Candidatus Woesearchaeota archaeon]|nr:Arc family DNA-binding protein [Candidatus Woesearchaeota archaeon]
MKKIEKVMVYFPEDLSKKLKEIAEKNTRSISGQVVHYVKQGIKMED